MEMKSVAEKKHNMVLECSIKKTILPKGMVPFPKEMTLPTFYLQYVELIFAYWPIGASLTLSLVGGGGA